ncbi:MAG: hypothetical protein MUF47_10900 [Porphyrobacter sp.]|nr:hypothetical protein [Porphyrobacter sp.]
MKAWRASVLALAGLGLFTLSAPAAARDFVRDGFAFPADGTMNIVVFRPDVSVGSQQVTGLVVPRADWTEAARTNIRESLIARAATLNAQVQFVDELEGEHAALLVEYRALYEKVSSAIFDHLVAGDTLPTKQKIIPDPRRPSARGRRVDVLDWSLGPGTARLKEVTGADYAMFVYTYDAYGDTGRKASQVVNALTCTLLFCDIPDSGVHIGSAALVELSSGNIVWFNSDPAMGGDPRESEGADKRVGQLMEGFPVREAMIVDER